MQFILSDHNCEGQAKAILHVLRYQGYASLLSIDLLFFHDVGVTIHPTLTLPW